MSDADRVDLPEILPGPGLHSPSELRRVQMDLAELRERYFELYELAPIGYATLDADGRVVDANLMLSTLLGIEGPRLLGKSLTERMPPADSVVFERLCAEAVRRAPEKTSVAVSLRREDSDYLPVMLEVAALNRSGGSLRVAVIDLRNLRQAEHRAREREARLQAVFDTVVDGIITVDAHGKIESSNAAAATLFRASPAELVGHSANRLMPGFTRLAGRDRVELMAERLDGSRFPAELGVSKLESGGSKQLVGVVTDISSRKRHEAELEEMLTRFRQIAEHIDDAIFVAEADTGKALYTSHAFETIWGRPTAEASSEPWPRLAWVHEEDRERVASAATNLRAGGSFDVEYRVVRPDGALRTVRCRTLLIPEQNRLTGIIQDRTNELALQAELRQAQRLEAIGTLASGVAHDFNNLLMGVGGCAQLAMRRLEPEHEAYAYLSRALDAILRGASLTRQILRFGDTRRVEEAPIELDAVVGGARDLIRSLVGERISFSIVTEAPGLSIAADPGDIEQVLLNLASNARDAMPGGGVLTFRTKPQSGGVVALSVRDTGTGMDEATKRRVFEPFFTTKEVGKGTGLGLSTVFAVARRMGGTISVESEPGEGTKFTLLLPVAIPDPSTEPATEQDATRGRGQSILIVDDDPLIRMTVETHVESLGYRALTASNVSEALKALSNGPRRIDVVLTDIMMPGLLGSDLGRILQNSTPRPALVYMSAHPWQELARQGHLTEGARLLAKPFDANALGAALHQALNDEPATELHGLRVFVVDDDADVIEAIHDLLQMKGHDVESASTLDEASRKILESPPDVVLCDLNVGRAMGGLELVSHLRTDERLAKTVFLAVTGMARHRCEPAALEAGFRGLLTKPFDAEELGRAISSAVRGDVAHRLVPR